MLEAKDEAWASRSTTKVQFLAVLMQADEVIKRQGIRVQAGPRLDRHYSGKGEASKFLLARAELWGLGVGWGQSQRDRT